MKGGFLHILILLCAISACESSGSGPDSNQEGQQKQTTEEGISTESIKNPQTASEDEVDTANLPEITFSKKEHDFGTVLEGQTVSHTFDITNTGSSDLIISNADAACGCTVPHYPKEPIPPGEKRSIKVSFNSQGKEGKQRKAVSVTANTQPNVNKIHIVANIKKTDG